MNEDRGRGNNDLRKLLRDPEIWWEPTNASDPHEIELIRRRLKAATPGSPTSLALFDSLIEEIAAGSRFRAVHDPRYHESGLVRAIISAAASMRERTPIEACEYNRLALHFAIAMDETTEILSLRGFACKELANTLFTRGLYQESLTALDDAEAWYSQVLVNRFELAIVSLVRGIVYQMMGRGDDALPLFEEASEVFHEFKATELLIKAQISVSMVLYSKRDFSAAHYLLLGLIDRAQEQCDFESLARIYNNLGHCAREMGEVDSAAKFFNLALPLFTELRMFTELPKVRWGLARMEKERGRLSSALELLKQTARDFRSVGVASDAAIVSIDVVELLLQMNRPRRAAEIAADLPRYFSDSGMNARAITAANFLREATASSRATAATARHVRQYITELRSQPTLEFRVPLL